MNYCVVTTINPPTKAIERLYEIFGSNFIVVGDKKTPTDWNYKDVTYIPYVDLGKNWFEGVDPVNHYARKNLGYLEAMRRGATYIYSTDDDNIPNDGFEIRDNEVISNTSIINGWLNVYDIVGSTSDKIWPRGLPLSKINNISFCPLGILGFTSSIQQGLADGEADVDAIWRLVFNKPVYFPNKKSIYLDTKCWCPFNSQSTHFFKKAFPLMYLPVTVSFRMTDIFGSFVAQRCLWEIGEGVTFHSPSEVFQDRNEHNLLNDFESEISGYLNSDKIATILRDLELKQGEDNICENMVTCYEALMNAGIVAYQEIRCLKQWIKLYENIN